MMTPKLASFFSSTRSVTFWVRVREYGCRVYDLRLSTRGLTSFVERVPMLNAVTFVPFDTISSPQPIVSNAYT